MGIDILIKNGLTRTSNGKATDIAVSDGKIVKIAAGINDKADKIIDAAGNLVTESFVNGHLHLCKVYTLEMVGMDALSSYKSGSMGGAMTAIEQAAKVKAYMVDKGML